MWDSQVFSSHHLPVWSILINSSQTPSVWLHQTFIHQSSKLSFDVCSLRLRRRRRRQLSPLMTPPVTPEEQNL